VKRLSLSILILCLAASSVLAAGDSQDPETWAEDLRGSRGTMDEAPAYSEPSTPSVLDEMPPEPSSYSPPADSAPSAAGTGSEYSPDHTEVPSAAGISQRKAVDLRGRVERLEDRIGSNERDIKDLEERVRILHRNFDEIRRRR